jgi:S-adenosyl-L-methionine hydrolase (adenosine-forming)
MILTFTDFGWQGPYLGEMRAAALRLAPTVPYVDLMADAPAFRPDLAAYLLAALAPRRWRDDVVIAVVDPGVGTERAPLAVRVNDVWFVGPDNGLFELLIRRTDKVLVHEITLRPKELSASFHGRDIFAPMAGRIAAGKLAGLKGGR